MTIANGRVRLLLAALIIGAAQPTLADEASDAFAKARELAAAGDTVGANAAIEQARDTLLKEAPLAFRQVLVVDSEATGFGIYKPRANNDFRNGETMVIYLEPVGFDYGGDGLGNNLLDLNCDVVLFDEKGVELAKIDNIAQLKMATRAKPKDLFLNISLSFDRSPFPVAAYAFDLIVTDRTTGKQAKTPIKFRITG